MKQISTYSTDFLVDAIALHDDMHLLHPIFSNPAILKVLVLRGDYVVFEVK